MGIKVVLSDARILKIVGSDRTIVRELKQKISIKSGKDCMGLQLMGKRRILRSSDRTFKHYDIKHEDTIHLVLKLTGGGWSFYVKPKADIDLDGLIEMQSDDGSWGSGIKGFGRIDLERPIKNLTTEVRDLLDEETVEFIFYTWLALKIIDKYFSDRKDELELVIRKGKDYIFVISNGNLNYKDINEKVFFYPG